MPPSGHSDEILRVYPSRSSELDWWSPQYGDLEGPTGWEFLPAGEAFVTRQVKRLGPHWIALRARKGYTETLGLLAPADNIQEARRLAEETGAQREAARERSRQQRARREADRREVFAEAVFRYLSFAPRYRALAGKIAQEVAQHATVVGSDRVGRTQKRSLEEKAELAARAHIRHRYTRYEERLIEAGLFDIDDEFHRDLKAEAQEEVDDFLERHRR